MCVCFIRLLIMLSVLKLISTRTEFTNFKCDSLDKEFSDFEYCSIKAINRSYKYVTVKVKLFQVPVTKVKVSFGLYKRFSGYRPFLYNVTVDACNFLRNRKSNPITSYFYDFIKDISNMNHTCPFDHDLVMDKLSTELVNHRLTNVLSFPEGDYMVEMHWIAYDITRAVVKLYLSLT
ncbi:uncharacterized protein LOC108031001 [Drosophila biarmipes]|uniref:uncharacterized protein LOC108031001 n=1 Tax=Drosophila biarmipes TaxID=125945 RepID=UPI0021CD0F07|nr:uncharacterized protein LOC108031001 [Drosophila biarmipes]